MLNPNTKSYPMTTSPQVDAVRLALGYMLFASPKDGATEPGLVCRATGYKRARAARRIFGPDRVAASVITLDDDHKVLAVRVLKPWTLGCAHDWAQDGPGPVRTLERAVHEAEQYEKICRRLLAHIELIEKGAAPGPLPDVAALPRAPRELQ